MSADLFAAFGQTDDSQRALSQEKSSQGIQDQRDVHSLNFDFSNASLNDASTRNFSRKSQSIDPWQEATEQADCPSEAWPASADDEWGDFEEAANSTSQPDSALVEAGESLPPTTLNVFQDQPNWSTGLSLDAVENDSTARHISHGLRTATVDSHAVVKPLPDYYVKHESRNEVLFDADDEIDDFGDFETGRSSVPAPITGVDHGKEIKLQTPVRADKPEEDLMSIFAEPRTAEQASAPKRPEQKSLSAASTKLEAKFNTKSAAKATSTDARPQRNKLQKKSAFQPLPTESTDDAWDDFETTVTPEFVAPKAMQKDDDGITPTWFISLAPPLSRVAPVRPGDVPPTNIPPPVILLCLFPPLFREMHSQFFQPLAGQKATAKSRILGDAKTIAYLRGCVALSKTAAHVIAGRKQRWKRDTLLSQGMRIGPAGRSGGMKLTGIDKSENNKEEREVLDVVRAWREQAGRLRSAIVSAHNASNVDSLGTIPDIQDTMTIQIAKQVDGGVPALNQCALCGLKRDERVVKVDGQVQDSFDEWWIAQMSMHTHCRNFWEEQKDAIRQR
ncbi:MAG: hypothetical protein M1822_006649 [Bathelium mastoideum]|nr:MAG: hypothetical protein M1822_006649 [Bathelium mastoideum]